MRRSYYNVNGNTDIQEVGFEEMPLTQVPYSKDLAKKVESLKGGSLFTKNETSLKGLVVGGLTGVIISAIYKKNMLLWSLGLGLTGLVGANLLNKKMKDLKTINKE